MIQLKFIREYNQQHNPVILNRGAAEPLDAVESSRGAANF
jgi:hypothetical protein